MEKANAAPVTGTDRDCNIISRKSGQTSIRSFFTREFTELLKGEIANVDRLLKMDEEQEKGHGQR